MFQIDTNTRAGRMMEAGQVTVTATSEKTGKHITVRAKALAKDEETGKWSVVPLAEAMFVTFEVPPASGEWYGDKVAKYTRAKGLVPEASADPARVFVAEKMLRFLRDGWSPAMMPIREESRCGRCGRQLTDPVSIDRGIGPECFGKATGSEHQVKQRDKAENETQRIMREAAADKENGPSGDDVLSAQEVQSMLDAQRAARTRAEFADYESWKNAVTEAAWDTWKETDDA